MFLFNGLKWPLHSYPESGKHLPFFQTVRKKEKKRGGVLSWGLERGFPLHVGALSTPLTRAEGEPSDGARGTWEHSRHPAAPAPGNPLIRLAPIGCPQGTSMPSWCYANEGESHWLGPRRQLRRLWRGEPGWPQLGPNPRSPSRPLGAVPRARPRGDPRSGSPSEEAPRPAF